jgi:hypothetical protein
VHERGLFVRDGDRLLGPCQRNLKQSAFYPVFIPITLWLGKLKHSVISDPTGKPEHVRGESRKNDIVCLKPFAGVHGHKFDAYALRTCIGRAKDRILLISAEYMYEGESFATCNALSVNFGNTVIP